MQTLSAVPLGIVLNSAAILQGFHILDFGKSQEDFWKKLEDRNYLSRKRTQFC